MTAATTAPARPSCAGADPCLFDDNRPLTELIATARTYCAGCPLRQQCADEGDVGLRGGILFRDSRRNWQPVNLLDEQRGKTPPTISSHCGTTYGYRLHQARGEHTCDSCREHRRRNRKAPRHPRVAAPCGTRAAAERHRIHGEQLCAECRAADSTYHAERYQRRRAAAAERKSA